MENKIKALFFAQYLGQEIAIDRVPENVTYPNYPFDKGERGLFLSGIIGNSIIIRRVADDVKDRFDQSCLLLRDISQLTDDEKEIIATRMQIFSEDVMDWINGDCGHDDFENLNTWLPCYDILKAFGILLPFTYLNEHNKPITLTPSELISRGWCKIKTQ